MTTVRERLKVGDRARLTMPWSDVCCHLRVAGKAWTVEVVAPGQAQLLDDDGRPYSFPITLGEAGIYTDAVGWYVPRN